MANNVQDATYEILKRIQESITELRHSNEAAISALRQEITQRFEAAALESRKDRRNINGLMALLQATAGDFDERIRDMDERVSLLEDRAS